jgi:hypothetical protein
MADRLRATKENLDRPRPLGYHLAPPGPHRLEAQDTALSRREQGFDSPWGRQKKQRSKAAFGRLLSFCSDRQQPPFPKEDDRRFRVALLGVRLHPAPYRKRCITNHERQEPGVWGRASIVIRSGIILRRPFCTGPSAVRKNAVRADRAVFAPIHDGRTIINDRCTRTRKLNHSFRQRTPKRLAEAVVAT